MSLALLVLPTLLQAVGQVGSDVDARRIERMHHAVSASPRLAGSKQDERSARWIEARFLEAGLRVETEAYDVLLSRPVKASLKLLGGKPRELGLVEKGFEWDRDSHNGRIVPAHIAYSPSGKVTAQVVYANYGLPADYRHLEELGVDVADRIVLVRYGKCYRGVKLRAAEERRAAAVLLYNDPADSGYVHGDPYPRGRMCPDSGVQRGSGLYMFEYPGDPLTPGLPAIPGTKRIRRESARSLPKITALPIPYSSAQAILESLGGPNVPRAWQGGLALAYHVGPGAARVALEVENKEAMHKIENVFGVLEGKSGRDGDFVLLGNHRDSWVNGAIDPASGTATMLEAAFVLGGRKDWKPDHTIRFASWGAEEYGVIGSTEYGENHADLLREHLLAYVNADAVVSGSQFRASATPSLRGFARGIATKVLHPDSMRPLDSGWNGHVGKLGGGSDFMVFLHRFGVPCVSFGMNGRTGVYHTAFDTHWFVKQRIDPGFRYHATVARTLVRALTDLASAEASAYAPSAAFVDCVDWLEAHKARLPAGELEQTRSLARKCAEQCAAIEKDGSVARSMLARLDKLWLDPRGLFGRAWFHNLAIAPGRHTGYAALEFPGIAEAIDARDEIRVKSELARLAERLHAASDAMRQLKAK